MPLMMVLLMVLPGAAGAEARSLACLRWLDAICRRRRSKRSDEVEHIRTSKNRGEIYLAHLPTARMRS